ncbi:hypothetical protein [Cohnella hashimotonis]|uniref:Uncharacterized protein n=1 Tax=Cohnella hashimotonis TaxID=2826895 RepID=A0ABT6TH36_9BACL|nr:hypothetical protein [Cohnella hashimotonis]MDI4645901.1 hypothetical protein [Cohnella hashimotonis]
MILLAWHGQHWKNLFANAMNNSSIREVVGIPFILIVAIFVLVALAIGVTIVSQIIAEQIRPTADSADWVKAGTGAFLLISMLNIPFIGFVLFVVLLLFSLGVTTSLIASLLRRRKQRTG